MIEDLWNDLVAALYSALFGIKEELWDTVSAMYFEVLYSYFDKSAGPLTDAFSDLVMASYIGVVVAGGVIILSYETLQTKYSIREIVPRLIIAILLVALAREITWQVYSDSKLLTDAFTLTDRVRSVYCDNFPDGSSEPIDIGECEGYESKMRSTFANHAFMVPTGEGANDQVGIFDVVMQVVAIWCYLVLLVIFWLRNIAWFCVLVISPLALACHALPMTEQFARYWWRLLGACLASSIGQAALIWVYHQLDGTVADEYVLDYHFQLFYVVLIVWLMWKLHKKCFELARGNRLNVPGSRLFMAFWLSRVMNGRSKRGSQSGRRRRRPPGDGDDNSLQQPSPNPRPRPPRQNHGNAIALGGSAKNPPPANNPPSANNGGNAPPARPVPSPAAVADRVPRKKGPLSRKEQQRFNDWEKHRRQADAFHENQTATRRQARDTGQGRRRDRRDEAVAEAIVEPRRDRSADAEPAETAARPAPAQDRAGWTARPAAHRRIAAKYTLPTRPAERPAPPADDGAQRCERDDEGGERS